MATTAVLAVHYEHDIVHLDGAFGPVFGPQVEARDVLTKTATFLDIARHHGALVVLLRIAFRPGHADLVVNGPLLGMVAEAGAMVDGEPGAEIVAEIGAAPEDTVLTHVRPGPFHGTGLAETLHAAGVTDVLVCGVATNVSVEAAFRGAADHGFRTVLLEDLCAAADPGAHEAAVASMALLGEVVPAAEAARGLAG